MMISKYGFPLIYTALGDWITISKYSTSMMKRKQKIFISRRPTTKKTNFSIQSVNNMGYHTNMLH